MTYDHKGDHSIHRIYVELYKSCQIRVFCYDVPPNNISDIIKGIHISIEGIHISIEGINISR